MHLVITYVITRQSTEYRVLSTEYRVQSTEYRVYECGTHHPDHLLEQYSDHHPDQHSDPLSRSPSGSPSRSPSGQHSYHHPDQHSDHIRINTQITSDPPSDYIQLHPTTSDYI